MKKLLPLLVVVFSLSFLTSCSELVKKTIEDNPEIVFEAIKKDPAKFMEVVREAAQQAQVAEAKKAQEEEDKAREEEFKNPKKPVISSNRAIFGKKDAKVTIVEYSDFQCPFCSRGSNTVKAVLDNYKNDVRLVFKHLPLEGKHPNARRGSEFFEAIAMQDVNKAYAFKGLVFENQNDTYGDAEALYKKLAKKVGANMSKLMADLKSKKDAITKTINDDMAEAQKFGFNGTPGYLINGVSLKGAYPAQEFKKIIDKHLGK